MSEKTPIEREEFDFKELEASISEPLFEDTLTDARTFNDLLRNQRLALPEVLEIIEELNDRIDDIKGTHVTMYGRIRIEDEDDEIVEKYLDGEQVIFNGFTAIGEADDQTVLLEQNFKIYFSILCIDRGEPYADTTTGSSENVTYKSVTAELDTASFEFPFVSLQRAKAWLSSNYPDVIDEIDIHILNTDETEAESILSLKTFEIEVGVGTEEDLLFESIHVYLNETIEIDTDVTYSFELAGHLWYTEDGDVQGRAQIQNSKYLGLVNSIHYMYLLTDGEEGKGTYVLGLDMVIINEHRNGPNIPCFMPLSSIQSMYSIRNAYYTN